ncbi:MAG TPA: hypothetical protein VF823_07170 [Anaerolineales bacterium]
MSQFLKKINFDRTLCLALLLGGMLGLFYVFFIPPWQHYDEPNHFEYAWLLAHRTGLVRPVESDPGLVKNVLASMASHGFYRDIGGQPDLVGTDQPASVPGYSQLEEPPLYYWLASLPMRLFPSTAIDAQLYAGRCVSWLLFLVTIGAAWGITQELTSPGSALRWMTPIGVALLPGLVDGMTALNNDVAAAAVFSLFLWASLCLVRRGFSWGRLSWAAFLTLLCYLAKSTAFIAFPVLCVALLFGILRSRQRKWAWAILFVGIGTVLAAGFSWDDAALWYRSTSQAASTRMAGGAGNYALRLDAASPVTPNWAVPLFQPLPLEASLALSGQSVTVGSWIWASQPVQVRTPVLNQGEHTFSQVVSVGPVPAFYAFRADLARDPLRVWITLDPKAWPLADGEQVYYSGLILVPGRRPLQEAPTFSTPDGLSGEWGGQSFANYIRNPSAENAGLRLRPWADALGARLLPDQTRPSLILASLLDGSGAAWYYRQSGQRLLRTFWGDFGWGNIPLLGSWTYRILDAATLLSLAGIVIALIRRRLPGDILALALLVLAGTWGAAMVRGPIYLAEPHLYLPVARYAFPAITLTVLSLVAGWRELFRVLSRLGRVLHSRIVRKDFTMDRGPVSTPLQAGQTRFSGWDWSQAIVFLLGFTILNLLAIVSISRFYGKG